MHDQPSPLLSSNAGNWGKPGNKHFRISTIWAIDHAARSSRLEGPDAFKADVACSLRSFAINAAEPSTHARAILRLGKQCNRISLMFSEASPYIVHSIHRRPRPMSAFLP